LALDDGKVTQEELAKEISKNFGNYLKN